MVALDRAFFFRTASGGTIEERMRKAFRMLGLGTMVILASAGCEESLLPDRVEVTPSEVTSDALGATHQFSANVLDKDGRAVGSAPVTWTSSNLNVASVSATGLATVVGPGTVTILASTDGAIGTAILSVEPIPTQVVSVTGNGQTAEVLFPLSIDPTVEVRDRLGSGLEGIQVAFSVKSGGGSVGTTSGLTRSDGRVSTAWTLGPTEGVQEITAAAAGISTTFSATAHPAPTVLLSSQDLQFAASLGSAQPLIQTVTVKNGGGGTLTGLTATDPTYTGAPPVAWLSASLDGTEEGATLTVVASPAGLPTGTYVAGLLVQSPVASNQEQSLTVTITVTQAPILEISATTAEFTATEGGSDPPDQTIAVENAGEQPLTDLTVGSPIYVGAPPAPWLSATLDKTVAPATLTLRSTIATLPHGTYEASVEVSSPVAENGSKTVTVTLTVLQAPRIALSSSTASFNAFVGGADPASLGITVQNGGGLTLTGLSVSDLTYVGNPPTAWLTATLGAGTAPTTLTLGASVAGLPVGSYAALVEISSPVALNSPRTVQINLTVQDGPEISLQPGAVSLRLARGRASAPLNISVQNSGNGFLTGLSFTISYGVGEPGAWLQNSTLSSTSAPSILSVTPTAAGLPVGEYHGSIQVSSSLQGVSPASSSVQLQVVPSFDLDVWPLFSGCGGCHFVGAGGEPPDLSTLVTAYQSLVGGGGTQYVAPGDPDPTVSTLTAQQIQLVKDWISGGALR